MRSVEIAKDVHWVGAVDWDLRDFHGYQTEKGTTYNAYLIKGRDKIALVDTVKASCTDQLLAHLQALIPLEQIDYVISHHAEMDHTGALPAIIARARPEKVFCSAGGEKALQAHFHQPGWPLQVVADGDQLDLGGKTLQFRLSKMLHWPDSMASYLAEDRILFSNDIFGQHLASSERFDDQVEPGELALQAAKYFANIFAPTAAAMGKWVRKLREDKLDLGLIACDHGVNWRAGVDRVLDLYQGWCAGETRPKAVLVYSTMWESTAKMARAIARGLDGDGVRVVLMDLRHNHRSDVMTELLDARLVALGSPVFNNGLLPAMADLLSYMKGLRPQRKLGAAFGSYGWSDTGLKQLNAALEEMKVQLVDPGLSVQYTPTEEQLAACEAMGQRLRQAVLQA